MVPLPTGERENHSNVANLKNLLPVNRKALHSNHPLSITLGPVVDTVSE